MAQDYLTGSGPGDIFNSYINEDGSLTEEAERVLDLGQETNAERSKKKRDDLTLNDFIEYYDTHTAHYKETYRYIDTGATLKDRLEYMIRRDKELRDKYDLSESNREKGYIKTILDSYYLSIKDLEDKIIVEQARR